MITAVGVFAMASIIGAASAAVSELQQWLENAQRLQIARYMTRKHLRGRSDAVC